MQELLQQRLYQFIREEHPDILLELEALGTVASYLEDHLQAVVPLWQTMEEVNQQAYIIEAACMNILTQVLRPSKYRYISNILEEEFESKWLELNSNGLLRYEVINIVNACETVFQEIGFTEENEDDKRLRYATIGSIANYFEQQM